MRAAKALALTVGSALAAAATCWCLSRTSTSKANSRRVLRARVATVWGGGRMSVAEPEGRRPSPQEIVDSHIELALCEAGFTAEQAALIVDEGADWRKAVEYIERGCPVDIALDLVID